MLFISIIAILALIAFAIGLLTAMPGHYRVSESRQIKVSSEDAFKKIRDFKSWAEWSPWIMHEPKTELTFSSNAYQVGGNYAWDGVFTGKGNVTHNAFVKNKTIHQTLAISKPFKSTSKIIWSFESITENETKVTWTLEGLTPWYKRWTTFLFSIEKMCSNDFRLGLLKLERALAEPKGLFDIEFSGTVERQTVSGIYREINCPFSELEKIMPEHFSILFDQVTNQSLTPTEKPFAAYTNQDMKKMTTTCQMVVPVEQSSPENTITFETASYFKVVYQGDYQHLELVWHAAMSHIFMTKQKFDRKAASLEVYVTHPKEVPIEESITEIYIPLKA